ncbi:tagatose 6-phosphate kinase [Belliella buryatensis]|uniref:Tagatose 6-phosphate kinase n=1 Tax=Belliella buryatensis TaxID=1500549 RepID=A0A239CB94_9BACT|nr:PfkB family carbohydrate kinase [Belliella buryatensis]SNS16958.1 tagatose 6-phosphate kinase [Belliella buryatensis]
MILVVCPNPSIDTYAQLECLKFGEPNRLTNIQEFPGGKGVHVALALQEMGSKVSLLGFWAGPNGEWVKSQCRDHGIDVGGISLSGNTRKCYTIQSADKRLDHTELLEPGPQMDIQSFESFKKLFAKRVKQAQLVIISGSWPMDSAEISCQELVKLCNQNQVDVILDCTGVQLQNALQENITALHLNEIEYKETNNMMPNELKSVSMLALTKGKDGLNLISNEGIIEGKVVLSKVISTVGSGDCLTAGLGFSLIHNKALQDHARYAVAFGAANCLRAELGMLYREDVERLLPIIEIKEKKYAQ